MVEVLIVSTAVLAVVLVVVFRLGRRYMEDYAAFSPVEDAWLREEAEGRISRISPGVLELAEKERAVALSMGRDEVDQASRVGAEKLVADATADDFWGRFLRASALVEDEPSKALGELDRLPELLEETIAKLDKAERLCSRRWVV